MDDKITKKRISHFLSYEWLKLLALIFAVIMGWNFIFSWTATRIRPTQQFVIFNHYANAVEPRDFYLTLLDAHNKNAFSYEVIEYKDNDMVKLDQSNLTDLIRGYLNADEGDVMFIPNVKDTTISMETATGEKIERTHIQSFLVAFRSYVYELGTYFDNLETLLNGYYTEGWENENSLDKAKVKRDFRARAKGNRDKRFQTEEKLREYEEKDVLRIQKYRDAYEKFLGYVKDGWLEITYVETPIYDIDGNHVITIKGDYAINLCPELAKDADDLQEILHRRYESALKSYAYYETKDVNGYPLTSAENMNMMFLKTPNTESGFEFESLLYVIFVAENCIEFAQQVA